MVRFKDLELHFRCDQQCAFLIGTDAVVVLGVSPIPVLQLGGCFDESLAYERAVAWLGALCCADTLGEVLDGVGLGCWRECPFVVRFLRQCFVWVPRQPRRCQCLGSVLPGR